MIWPKPTSLEFLRSFILDQNPLTRLETGLLNHVVLNLLGSDSTVEQKLVHTQPGMVDVLQAHLPVLLRNIHIGGQIGI